MLAVGRYLVAVLVVVLGAYATYRLAWKPFLCNIDKAHAQIVLLSIFDLPPTLTVASNARRGITTMEQCIAACPTDVDLYMTLAGYEQVIGRSRDAIETYRNALAYDRRPEIFLNIGLLQLQMNQRDAAIASLTDACLFNINFVNEISNLSDRDEVLAAVHARQARGIAPAQGR